MHLNERVEFFRNCYILVPDINDKKVHETVLLFGDKRKAKPSIFCSCSRGGSPRCDHSRTLFTLVERALQEGNDNSPGVLFQKSLFHTLFSCVARNNNLPVDKYKVDTSIDGLLSRATVTGINETVPTIIYESPNPDFFRFISRMGVHKGPQNYPSRHQLMVQSSRFTLSSIEQEMKSRGCTTTGLGQEESAWNRLAYHCFRELDQGACIITPSIDGQNGICTVTIRFTDAQITLRVTIPSDCVASVLAVLKDQSPATYPFKHYGRECELHFHLDFHSSDGCVNMEPVVDVGNLHERRFLPVRPECIYGINLYLPLLDGFVTLTQESMKRVLQNWCHKKEIESERLPSFLEENMAVFSFSTGLRADQTDLFALAPGDNLGRLTCCDIERNCSGVSLKPVAMEGMSCQVSIGYMVGDIRIPLTSILDTLDAKNRFCVYEGLIIDCWKEPFCSGRFIARQADSNGILTVHRASLLQFGSDHGCPVTISGSDAIAGELSGLISGKSIQPMQQPIAGLLAILRKYQVIAIEWLLFLYDNRLGALLCDDMGLGKTLEVLAFFKTLQTQRECKQPFLVVCPTSVMYHWQELAERFTPSLVVRIMHGNQRELLRTESGFDLLVTSYGILRNDIEWLSTFKFEVAVFDEAHCIKNAQTFSAQASRLVRAEMKIGLTGTPIENSLNDLQTLLNLVLPGLLTSDTDFERLVETSAHSYGTMKASKSLHAIIKPFILRRTKQAVLTELPAKIEEKRQVHMSIYQQELYSSIVMSKGQEILSLLSKEDEAIPYFHVFSLLSTFKKICNHPAIFHGNPVEYGKYECGKWELFTELLMEGVGSGQKVVVFSTSLDMLRIMEHYCQDQALGFVTLEGATRDRKGVIKGFNSDPSCRVFLGSLKAGGVGIDLTAGSVVIHYDRWWNAAREDQATDRVHRIGQNRGVQVFKLITRNTIEDSIDNIISRKKRLSENALVEDSPDSVKIFSRQELIQILSYSGIVEKKGILKDQPFAEAINSIVSGDSGKE